MIKNLKNITLLYAEDEEEIGLSMKEYFESYFKKVYLVTDGREALRIYHAYRPEVMILDINMPYINGLDVAREIRKQDKYSRIVMLSAHSQTDLLLQATEIDMSKYLVKPISPKELKEVLHKVAKELLYETNTLVKLSETVFYDSQTMNLLVDSHIVSLLEKERKLLKLLVENKNRCVSYEEIMVHVWTNSDDEVSRDSIKSQVNYLRKKLPKNSLVNVYGEGYSLHI